MIILFPLMLILIGTINLLMLRSKKDKLNVFNKVERTKDHSFINQLSSKRKNRFSASLMERLLLTMMEAYLIIFGNLTRSERLKNIGFLCAGVSGCLFVNNKYIELPFTQALMLSIVLVLVVLYLRAKAALKKEFADNFPEALSILVGIVSTGSSISQGFTECGLKVEGTVGRVFMEISKRLSIGEDSDKVLLDSYRYLPFREYYFFILAIIVNLQGGGEIKEVIYRLSKMITNNRALERSRDGKTAEVRMTVKILSVLPFAFIFLLQFISPENYQFLFNDPTGRYILYYVIGSVAFGQLIIRNMLSKIV